MPALSNVAITDTFDTWRVRTNQIILKTNDYDTTIANSYIKANTANYYAYLVDANATAAFSKANTANYYAYLVDANTNAVFSLANSVNIISVNAWNKANTANVIAKLGYDQANAANIVASSSYDTTNLAFSRANVSYTQANTAYTQANLVFGQANTAYTQANLVFGQANTAYNKANSANYYAYLVDANTNAAFAKANAALANTSGITFAGNMTITGNLTALSYNTSSDERLKFIINTAPSGVSVLSPKQYEMISHPGIRRYGFVAQEVQNTFPDLVSTDETGMLTLNYLDIIALMIQEIKDLKTTVQEIQKKVSN